jgi:hypothetical protein
VAEEEGGVAGLLQRFGQQVGLVQLAGQGQGALERGLGLPG